MMLPPSPQAPALPPVSVSEEGGVRHLHLGTPWVQGSMRIDRPFELVLEYVQRMMVWLLFVDPDTVAQRRAMQMGLGAAALTKFCVKKLHMDTTAIEINPQVVLACRNWFKLPADSERLHVVLADAGNVAADGAWQGQVDALQVDLYDHEAAAPVLDSTEFYANGRRLLSEDGAMAVNLFGRHASYVRTLNKIRDVYGPQAVWAFAPTREGNTVVLALRSAQPVSLAQLQERAAVVQARWRLPAKKWLAALQPPAG